MNLSPRVLVVGALLTTAVIAAVLFSVGAQRHFAASSNHSDGEIDVRVQARQTEGGRVEVRAQTSIGEREWMTHTPDLRFLTADAEFGRWYSSSPLTVSVPAPAPEVSDEAAYTQFFVEEAIDYYQRHGRDVMLAFYNSPESVDGQWYMFIFDADDILVAHENPELVGLTDAEVNGPDGYPAGRMVVAAASEAGSWVDYQFNNPTTGEAEIKHSWIVRHDGLIFGSGWYEDAPSKEHAPGAYTQSYVERALEMYRVLGREATFEYYNSTESIDGEWYLFIHQDDGTRLVNGAQADRPGWLGSNLHGSGVDVTGYDYVEDTLAIDPDGWISYVFPNPDAELRYQRKHSWLLRRDGMLFGSGWYDRNYDLAEEDPAGYSRALVQTAIDLYDSEGRQAMLDRYNSADSADGEWYVFVIDGEGEFIAHPTRPDLVGELLQDRGTDVTGFDFGSAFLAITENGWVSYVFGNPDSGRDEQKHTWLVRHDGLLFGSGWYEPGAYEAP
ncbi:MAG: hypothetical protein OXD50_10070 [Chloroflexi bacterium]|nr:hypothetical protein [Chloroflexota bacterium]